ncbi:MULTISPECIES: hypothetical protein [Burkholderia]|uniref:Pilus assembly protein n=1 Tax=Burkholderia contaminans TaxID=488447 RepID=A0A2S5E432_9BURK|nr:MULTISPECIES: hypothetical protein [Burkholderia]EKS9798737.1 hypothetical protein [Burkholderia cepacia]EKS9803171.1 hypothetical protein [Burkholderia cepacia]EKS9810655.1 hypothetical protein [Burkholderia cepacia]EKS9819614.1 hypothetical protein [Burkholderia cepacia]EKS9827232.1 hypothetical protein [Burkholderia cepacia]
MKLRSVFSGLVLMMAGMAVAASAQAAIDLIPKELVIRDKAETVRIVNRGDRTEYVSISLSRMLNPGVELADEKLEPVGDMLQPALFASPFRVTLAPGQTKVVTLKPTRSVDAETVYRLDVQPMVRMLGENQQRAAGSVVVNLAFKGLVRQLPERERATAEVTCGEHGARITATGNVRYTVSDAMVDGHKQNDFNVYPGTSQSLKGVVIEVPGQRVCRG